MRAPIFFYIGRNYPSSATGEGERAVPVHIVDVNKSGRANVRVLAGRMAGAQIAIDRSELHRSPGDSRLVPGSHKAIAQYGQRELEETAAARALRKRIGSRRLTERQLRNAFERTIQLAERVRPKTPNDRAWVYFGNDLEDWYAGHRVYSGGDLEDGRRAEGLLIQMLDMVLGAAERYQPPPVDQQSAAYARAEMLDAHANALYVRTLGSGFGDPRPWLEVADAFEVSEDAWREAGDDDHADRLAKRRHDILETVREPRWQ